jgi:hypothetical protein
MCNVGKFTFEKIGITFAHKFLTKGNIKNSNGIIEMLKITAF